MDRKHFRRNTSRKDDCGLFRLGCLPCGPIPSYTFPKAVFSGQKYINNSSVVVPIETESNESSYFHPPPPRGRMCCARHEVRRDGQAAIEFSRDLAHAESLCDATGIGKVTKKSKFTRTGMRTERSRHQKSFSPPGNVSSITTSRRVTGRVTSTKTTGLDFHGERARSISTGTGHESKATTRRGETKKNIMCLKNNLNAFAKPISNSFFGFSQDQSSKMTTTSSERQLVGLKLPTSLHRNIAVPKQRNIVRESYHHRNALKQRSRAIAIKRNRVATENEFEQTPASCERMYDYATWRMYNRIIDYRSRQPVSHAVYIPEALSVSKGRSTEIDNRDDLNPYPSSVNRIDDLLDGEVFELEI